MAGCGQDASTAGVLTGQEPPKADIRVDGQLHETKLGSYCWTARCVDTIGADEQLKGEEPVKVSHGAKVEFVMDYKPLPNKFNVLQMKEDGKHTELHVADHSFQAPIEKGVYYYSFGVWWMDSTRENVVHGDAFYHFVLEVA
ncbi:hypothetical protein D3P07_17835 [Paenibacillus sp. 1011MAR3C5]|nr:hypothetical protein D3P07_17835 [Paenibacillus sp. 1011MAR3C5]